MGSSGGRAKLGWAFLRSVVAQQQHRLSSSAAPIAPAATAPNRVGAPHWPLLRIGAPPLFLTRRQSSASTAAAASVSAIRDEANLTRPAAAVHVGIDHHHTAPRKASWGSAWLFAAAGLMAFSTTDLGNALPTTEENKTTDGGAKPVKKQRVVFVLGGPGSGKGTQCTKIVDNYGFLHLSAGDLLRAEIKSGSPNGNMIKSMIKEGKIVPSEVTVKLLDKAMNESKNDKFLIDGFPRNEENRAAFEKGTGISPEFILFFDCPEEVLEKRLLGRNEGRDDDNIETIRKRFKVFIESSVPVIDHYNTIGKVRKIDATKDKEEVFNAVEPLFKPFLSDDLLRATELLLRGIDSKDFELYKDFCDPGLTAFEPEAAGHLVEGLDFHEFYFEKGNDNSFVPQHSTIIAPKVTLLGDGVGLVTCTRLVRESRHMFPGVTKAFNETRVWVRQRVDGEIKWKNVHFHRSSV